MAHCDVDLLFKEKGGGLLELGLKNNMDKTYEIRYDRLPWVLAGGGVDFNVLIDGEKVRKGVGAGQNNVILRIGAKYSVSSDVDINYLRSFYRNVPIYRVKIFWTYDLPSEMVSGKCRHFEGVIAAP